MDHAKIVVFFENGQNGWQEVYYCAAGDLNTAFNSANQLRIVRADLMAEPTTIIGLRVEDATENRESQLTPFRMTAPVNYQSRADNVAVAAMMRLYSNPANRTRALYLRGNPDNAYDVATPNNVDAQTWKNKFDVLGTFLTSPTSGTTWEIKAKQHADRSPAGNAIPIISVAPTIAGSGRTSVTTSAAHGLDDGDYVTLYQMGGVSRLSGVFKVIGIAGANDFVIPFHFPSGDTYNGAGFAVPFVEEFSRMSAFAVQPRWTRRVTGRPFEVSRGRRRAIRR